MWEGSFESTRYRPFVGWIGRFPKVAGTLIVTKNAAIVTYTGPYRWGQVSSMKIDVSNGTGAQPGVGYFKGECMKTNQVLTFTVLTKTDDEITGTYSSVSPIDDGTFRLTRKSTS
jgi:hypothetical protein